ncbi:MAG: hypothetical protein Kow00120_18320 [Anaerolineae bacterium]
MDTGMPTQAHKTVYATVIDNPIALRLSDAEAGRLAAGFKALGHPARVQIVDLLSRCGGRLCVREIEEQFDLTQPTISRHLKVLRDAGLAVSERQGLWVYYVILPQALARLRALLEEMRQQSASAEYFPETHDEFPGESDDDSSTRPPPTLTGIDSRL